MDFERITGFPNNNSRRRYDPNIEYLLLLDSTDNKPEYHVGNLLQLVKKRIEYANENWIHEDDRAVWSYFMAIYFELTNGEPTKIISSFKIGDDNAESLEHIKSITYGNVPPLK